METYLIGAILGALKDGETREIVAWVAVFVILWLEIRGIKKEFHTLNKNIGNRFDDGEKRFKNIEGRIDGLESLTQGGHHGKSL